MLASAPWSWPAISAPPAPREKSTITSMRARRLSDFAEQGLEIGPQRGAALLV